MDASSRRRRAQPPDDLAALRNIIEGLIADLGSVPSPSDVSCPTTDVSGD
jgi:hypothetical protein